jgi:F420-dependent oxidoreductase-like protein
MLEAYTALGALATATQKVQLGTLVTGNTYRNPTLLAKIITTLDVISQGRAVLGIGTGWFELEHDQLGFDFGTFTDRFAKLEEALQILLPMIAGEHVTFTGAHYRTEEAFAVPRMRDHIPLMIGGRGEKKTFGLAARYFDHLNVIASFAELPGKVEAIKLRCAEVDRDPATLETSVLLTAVPDPNFSADKAPEATRGRMVGGSPDQIAEAVKTNVVDAGIDGVVINLPSYRPGSISELGAALRPVVGG